MNARRWVIIGLGLAVMASMIVVALVVDEHWVEVAGWIAGVAGFVVAAATLVLSLRGVPAPPAAITLGDNSGVIVFGDDAKVHQRRSER